MFLKRLEMKKLIKILGTVAAALALPLAHAGIDPNIVTNGGFDLSGGWTYDTHGVATVDTNSVLSSPKSLRFKNVSDKGSGFASQWLGNILGIDGSVSFAHHFQFYTYGDVTGLSAVFDDADPLSTDFEVLSEAFKRSTSNDWTLYSGDLSLDATYTLIFSITDGGTFDFNIDNVSLVDARTCTSSTVPGCDNVNPNGGGNVPEPGTLFLVGAALAAGGLARRKLAKA